MTSIALSALLPPPPAVPIGVGAIAAAAPVAAAVMVAAQNDAYLPLPLPTSQPLAPTPPHSGDGADGANSAAMRPDQLFMSRQLSFQRADATALASGWRTMVRQYGSALVEREVRSRGGQLAPATLLAAQEGRVMRPNDPSPNADPWRFTVHAGGQQAQDLRVVGRDAEPPPGRRRRARVGLRLELTLEDGTRVAVQIEPIPGGVALELSAPGAAALVRLRRLEPALIDTIERAGLKVAKRSYSETLATGGIPHAFLAAQDATSVLTLPVFKAVAELALLLPAWHAPDAGQAYG